MKRCSCTDNSDAAVQGAAGAELRLVCSAEQLISRALLHVVYICGAAKLTSIAILS